ncbi:hypothetical protein FOMG_17782 [Fusarium oxysporum f. sp. melonis 26406]|uniref:Uncharacterized protein n=1 Tax=Fusarium oxysporum f. sp. melonis 26406 TaxID=1089452 RepID=W9ZBD9_FUSOX|nr:hypothetical protein FOMG_17782 [Fusarium oxysporum f. sp. melonis 26406]
MGKQALDRATWSLLTVSQYSSDRTELERQIKEKHIVANHMAQDP